MASPPPHPLAQLSRDEFITARNSVLNHHGPGTSLFFRSISLQEPKKNDLVPFLIAEHDGGLSETTPRPARCAQVEYDMIGDSREYTRAIVDIAAEVVVCKAVLEQNAHPYFAPAEVEAFQGACVESEMFKDAMSEFVLPEGFAVCIDPWPYGGTYDDGYPSRYMQGLVFARDVSKNNPDANHYAYPIPIIPVMDLETRRIIRVDRLATGGSDDGLEPKERGETPKKLFEKSHAAEYAPELLDRPLREGLKPLDVTQPEGASFTVSSDGLVEWQRWRFRLGFTPREGAVLHDVCYENRPILYRLSYSELTVPYGDPRPPFHRKHAFDLGDGGVGRAANNLELGCDCLGVIHYIDSYLADPEGMPTPAKSVVCLHEQDNGILWKHTNFRTSRAVVTRMRELVVQFIITLANYEYVFAFKLDLAGSITIETRATGIVSVVGIDEDKTSKYGNVVAPGVLAQNHQHVFSVRIDPAVDSYGAQDTQVVVEESVGRPTDPKTNPMGNLYQVERKPVTKASWTDAEPRLNRLIKLEHATKRNAMSGRPVGYKLVPPATQMLLADEKSVAVARAPFAKHHLWVTGYRDGELWAAGEFTNQSKAEVGGVAAMVKRGDWFTGEETASGQAKDSKTGRRSSPVVWVSFGLTHNPRVEDWPVMPVETQQIHLRPADFFTSNPALDVPSTKNKSSVLLSCCGDARAAGQEKEPLVQEDPLSHLQGRGPDIEA
ncbi:hypothetical protein F66182_397 [Fusarium sp. NRRL 66182]|nr:hypothetical protein F66182_397 [Fusarium sp. NRRL 66182]